MSLYNPNEGGSLSDAPAASLAVSPRLEWRSALSSLVVLFKLRIVALLLLGAVGGAFLGAGGWPGLGRLLVLLLTGGLAAAGASALNQYLERDTDGDMVRTRRRPLVTGAISRPGRVLVAGILMIVLPALAVLPGNPALALFLALGAVIYVGVYTIWLKPRTLLNIVIGGAAGSAAVLSGGAAVDGWRDPAVWVLALLVFLWTPTHFWALAILYRKDYSRARIPMLPVQTSPRQSAWWVMVHSGATALAALLLAATPALGLLYLLPIALVTIDLLARNVSLIRQPDPARARSLFMASNIYLMVVLLAIVVATMLPPVWPN
jgi:protoheme IX farnesyltransferase